MIEKKTLGYVDFNYPNYEATAVTAFVNTDTNQVEIYQTEDGEWFPPVKTDHFYQTIGEASEELEAHKKELIAKMPEVKEYLDKMRNWFVDTDKDNRPFKESDYLPCVYLPSDNSYYREHSQEVEKLNDYLVAIIKTGFINIGGDTVKIEDIEQVKWGDVKAELCLKGDRKAKTSNCTEFKIIKMLFGINISGFTYKRLNEYSNEE